MVKSCDNKQIPVDVDTDRLRHIRLSHMSPVPVYSVNVTIFII